MAGSNWGWAAMASLLVAVHAPGVARAEPDDAKKTGAEAEQQLPPPVESAPGEITGKVVTASPDGLVLSVKGVPDVKLRMKPRTIIALNGQMASVGDIQKGYEVRALYRDVGGDRVAIFVDAKTAVPVPKQDK